MAQEVASIFARVGADLSDFHRGMGQFNSAIHGAGGMFRSFTTGIVQGIGQAFGYASLRAIREFGEVVAGVIGAAADMEQSVANIAATMGLTAEETARVSALVSELGIDPKLKVTATEAAAAIEMLGKNGLTLDQIMQGAARSTVLLSNSTGADFSTAADVATSAMSQFKIGAENMSGAIDQIVGVTRNSKFDINDYRLAISQAGGVAASVGVDFADFNATIAAISPLFASGSDAGTSFKTFLQRLVPQSAEAADVMRDIGLYTGLTGKEFDAVQDKMIKVQQRIEDLDPTSKNYSERLAEMSAELTVLQSQLMAGGSAFFDSSGQMKSMSEIAQALQTSFSALSEEQKINASSTIFGTDAMRAAFALADSGAGTIDKLKATIGNVSAEESAAIRMNTLKGAWEIFTGIVESLSIKFGTAFLPALRDVVAALTDLAGRVGPQLEVWGAQLGERLKLVAGAAIELLNVGLDKGLLAIFEPLPDGTRELDKLWQSFGLTTEESKKLSERLIGTARVIMDTTSAVASLIGTIANIVSPMVTWIDKNIGLENALRGVALVMAGGFVASIVSTIATIVSAISTVVTFVAGLTGLGATATTIGGAVATAIAAMGGPITLLIAAIGALALAWQNNWWDIQGKTAAAWEAIKGFFSGGWETLKRWTSDGIAAIKDFFTGWGAVGENMMRGLVDGIKAGWQWVTTAAKSVAQGAFDAAKSALGIFSPSREFEKLGSYSMEGFARGLGQTGAPLSSLRATLDAVQRDGVAFTAGTLAGQLSGAAQRAMGEFGRGFSGAAPGIAQNLGQILGGLGGAVGDLARRFGSGADGAAQDLMIGLVNGINQRMRWLTDVAGDLARAVLDPIKRALGIASPSKVFQELGQNVTQGFAQGIGDGLQLPTVAINRMVRHTIDAAPAGVPGGVSLAGGSQSRLDIYLHGDSALPTDRAKLRELARALQQEFVFTGARVAVP